MRCLDLARAKLDHVSVTIRLPGLSVVALHFVVRGPIPNSIHCLGVVSLYVSADLAARSISQNPPAKGLFQPSVLGTVIYVVLKFL